MKKLVIEEGVTKIGVGAFQGSMIKKVIIPSTVTEIVLGGAERVYCFGETDKNVTAFLKKHYKA